MNNSTVQGIVCLRTCMEKGAREKKPLGKEIGLSTSLPVTGKLVRGQPDEPVYCFSLAVANKQKKIRLSKQCLQSLVGRTLTFW